MKICVSIRKSEVDVSDTSCYEKRYSVQTPSKGPARKNMVDRYSCINLLYSFVRPKKYQFQ